MPAAELVFPLVPRRRLLGMPFGTMHSARRGLGSDVAGSRPYLPGDDVDAIDWYASARLSSARAADEFIVRERFAEEAPRVVCIVDRRPAMALYPPGLPWLSKPHAVETALEVIAASTFAVRGLVGYLDVADAEHPDPAQRTPQPVWRTPQSQAAWRRFEAELAERPFHAAEDTLDEAFSLLREAPAGLPTGTFVFVLSDFLAPPHPEVWLAAGERRWDVVPVIVQDPVWEQSFPDVGGVAVPVVDPATGRAEVLRLTRAEARNRRAANERRLHELLDGFLELGIEPVVLSSSDPVEVVSAFLEWASERAALVDERRRGTA